VLDFIRLMWSVEHELQRVSKRMVAQLGLTAPQRLGLRFIGRQPGLTAGALADALHMHPGTVTGIVARLEELGLVTRARSTEDTRRVHLSLTQQGTVVNRRSRGTVEAAVRRVVTAVTGDELEAASRVMQRVAAELAAE
jgi:MarR family transcriptional regulator, organic hydroperoxide resistance regulator